MESKYTLEAIKSNDLTTKAICSMRFYKRELSENAKIFGLHNDKDGRSFLIIHDDELREIYYVDHRLINDNRDIMLDIDNIKSVLKIDLMPRVESIYENYIFNDKLIKFSLEDKEEVLDNLYTELMNIKITTQYILTSKTKLSIK